jgi:hypothetical protein
MSQRVKRVTAPNVGLEESESSSEKEALKEALKEVSPKGLSPKALSRKEVSPKNVEGINYQEIINQLRVPFNINLIKKEEDLLKKVILCKYYLTAPSFGPLLEAYIKTKYKIKSAVDCVSGDGCKDGKNIEIKVSLGDKQGQLNYVQIRPDHNIDYYILLAYNMYEKTTDSELIPTYGGYAHGTILKHGKITKETMYGRNLEFALRPNPNQSTRTKSHRLWLELKKFIIV